jgi:hypothetical protein
VVSTETVSNVRLFSMVEAEAILALDSPVWTQGNILVV